MSQALQTSSDCAAACEENPTTSIPGATGGSGAAGTNGTNGLNAFTTVTTQFLMPASLGSVTIDVGSSAWAAVNEKIFIGAGASRGTFEVTAKPSATQLTLTNLETATAYTDNSPAATVFPVGSIVTPSGLQGEPGSAAAGGLLAANNLSDVANVATSRSNLGLGTAAVLTSGVANGNLAPVNDAGGLTNGESVWATATGVESRTAVLARSGLGLVLGIADTNIAPVNVAAGLIAGDAVFATAAGVETKTAAAARTALGIGGSMVFHAIRAAAANQGGVASGAPTPVQFNGELFDVGAGFNTGTYAWVPGTAGYYQLHAQVKFNASGGAGSTTFAIRILKNGVSVAEYTRESINHNVINHLAVSTIQQSNGADSFTVQVEQASGLAMVINGTNANTFFCGSIVPA